MLKIANHPHSYLFIIKKRDDRNLMCLVEYQNYLVEARSISSKFTAFSYPLFGNLLENIILFTTIFLR